MTSAINGLIDVYCSGCGQHLIRAMAKTQILCHQCKVWNEAGTATRKQSTENPAPKNTKKVEDR